MRKIVLLILLSGIFISCDLLKSKDQLLTEKEWVLHHKFDTETQKMPHFKKSEKALTLNFKGDGTVYISEDNGSKHSVAKWEWMRDDYIELTTIENGIGEYHIMELNSNELLWTKSTPFSDIKQPLEYFWHIDNNEWNDKEIEQRRKFNLY